MTSTSPVAVVLRRTLSSFFFAQRVKPLPYRDSGRLANLWVDLGVGNQSLPAVSPGDFRDYQQRSRLFESFAAATGAQLAGVNGALRAADGSETEAELTITVVGE